MYPPPFSVLPRLREPPPTDVQIERQIRWEAEAVEAGIRRYRAALNDPTQVLADTSAGQRIIREIMAEFVPWLKAAQKLLREGLFKRGPKEDWTFLIQILLPDVLAYLTLRAVMSERPTEKAHLRVLTGCSRSLANSIEQEVAFRSWVVEERKNKREAKQLGKPYRDLYDALKQKAKKVDSRAFRSWMNRLGRLWRQDWDPAEKTKLGNNLIKYLVDHSGGRFKLELARYSGRTPCVIVLSDEARALIEDQHARAEIMSPPHRPMLCEPEPWHWVADEDAEQGGSPGRYVGGYYQLPGRTLIRSGANTHTAALVEPFSSETLAAINAVQSTPWQINRAILEVMQEVSKAGAGFEDLVPRADREPLPARIPPEVWETMPEGAQEAHKARLAEVHRRIATTEGKRYAWVLRLDMAKQLAEEPAIWFPYFADFRGRLYADVPDLSPQGADASKALLRFAHGKPLGKLGLHWLCVRAANYWAQDGVDKLDPYDRARWTEANMDRIHEAADNPIDGTRWWTDAEKPWCFLATCFEISAAMRSDDDFVSHLPVPLDGSCNGLQHLAALGRDLAGAIATNVVSELGARRDIYTEVARRVNRMVTEDAGKGNALAQQWLGKVDRKTVKRAVMTTPYGVTDRGMATQLIEEGFTEGMGEESAPAANYLKDLIIPALTEAVGSAKQIMAWLQAVAEALAKDDIPFRWQTPTGNTVEQAYWDLVEHRVQSLVGQTTLYREAPSSGLRRRKQCLSAAPNVVHSFDAAHLCRVVNAAGELGLADFAVVHDSFGVHAADTARLGDILRDEFAKIYDETNWLEKIEQDVREYAPQVEIPPWTEYVTLGDLQLFPAVMGSRYAFA